MSSAETAKDVPLKCRTCRCRGVDQWPTGSCGAVGSFVVSRRGNRSSVNGSCRLPTICTGRTLTSTSQSTRSSIRRNTRW